MSDAAYSETGIVASLWRYPVKSMAGEELAAVDVSAAGLLADRTWGLRDNADGKIATAKNPRKWPNLFAFQASYTASGAKGQAPLLRITLPDGTVVSEQTDNVDQTISGALGRDVTLVSTSQHADDMTSVPESTTQSEEYWPDLDGLDQRNTVTDFELPPGTFFDCATVHLLTTATLAQLHSLYPQGQFDLRRFRPNIFVSPAPNGGAFAEDAWIGKTIAIGDEVRLRITGPCGRCVMTTLAQRDLLADLEILRTAVQHHGANVGVYAAVLRGGTIRRGDRVFVHD